MNKKVKILVIEDEFDYLTYFGAMLQNRSEVNLEYEIEQVKTLSIGIERGKENNYDVILLDLGLPDSKSEETFK